MDIHSLTYFKKVAELQHITRASEELHVAQPSLSRTISRLEKELGVQLFERSGKNIILNSYGEILLKHTNRILQELKDIDQEIGDAAGERSRTVTLSLYAASKLLPELVMAFKHEYPSIRLQIIQEDLTKNQPDGCHAAVHAGSFRLPDRGRNSPGPAGVQSTLQAGELKLKRGSGRRIHLPPAGKEPANHHRHLLQNSRLRAVRRAGERQPGDRPGTDPRGHRHLLHPLHHLAGHGHGEHRSGSHLLSAVQTLHQLILARTGISLSCCDPVP